MKDVLFNVYTERGARVTIVPVTWYVALALRTQLNASKNKALHGAVIVRSDYRWEHPALFDFDPNFLSSPLRDISEALFILR